MSGIPARRLDCTKNEILEIVVTKWSPDGHQVVIMDFFVYPYTRICQLFFLADITAIHSEYMFDPTLLTNARDFIE